MTIHEAWGQLTEGLKHLSGAWATIAAGGTFVLYLFGYLSLRFKLTALGVGTDLHFLDERYLFEGVRFLVFTVAVVPHLLLVALLAVGPLCLLYLMMPRLWRERVAGPTGNWMRRLWGWWQHPPRLTLAGIVFSLFVIQIFMRKVFDFSNILVRGQLARWEWINCVLLNEPSGSRDLYFYGLVAAAALTGFCLLASGALSAPDGWPRAAGVVLAFLFAVQLLLLPINHGVLISAGGQSVPRVTSLDGLVPLAGTTAWLVWEGRDGVTYLVKCLEGHEKPALVTLPKAKVMKTEIVGYDNLMKRLFDVPSGCAEGDR